jgi:hypothetical protein
MKTWLLALAFAGCGGNTVATVEPQPEDAGTEDAVPDEPCDVVYTIDCGPTRALGTFANCGGRTGYVVSDGARFDCAIGDRDGCLAASRAALAYCEGCQAETREDGCVTSDCGLTWRC